MKRLTALASLAVALSLPTSAAFAQDDAQSAEAKPEKISDRSHPDFIRCRTEAVIGSRAKKRKVCLTNREWEEFARRGNEVARRTVEDNASGVAGN